jgi:hypothetical protein
LGVPIRFVRPKPKIILNASDNMCGFCVRNFVFRQVLAVCVCVQLKHILYNEKGEKCVCSFAARSAKDSTTELMETECSDLVELY